MSERKPLVQTVIGGGNKSSVDEMPTADYIGIADGGTGAPSKEMARYLLDTAYKGARESSLFRPGGYGPHRIAPRTEVILEANSLKHGWNCCRDTAFMAAPGYTEGDLGAGYNCIGAPQRSSELVASSEVSVTNVSITDHAGTVASGYLSNGSSASGQKTVTIGTGTGPIIPGCTISFSGHSGSYIVDGSNAVNATQVFLTTDLTSTVNDGETVTVSSYPRTLGKFTRSSGSFVTDEYWPCMQVDSSGFAAEENNDDWFVLMVDADEVIFEDPTGKVTTATAAVGNTVQQLLRNYAPSNGFLYNLGPWLPANSLGKYGKFTWEWDFHYMPGGNSPDEGVIGFWRFDAIQKFPLYSEGALAPAIGSATADGEAVVIQNFSKSILSGTQPVYVGRKGNVYRGRARMEMRCVGLGVQEWSYWENVDQWEHGEFTDPWKKRTFWDVENRDLTFRFHNQVLYSGSGGGVYSGSAVRVDGYCAKFTPGRHWSGGKI